MTRPRSPRPALAASAAILLAACAARSAPSGGAPSAVDAGQAASAADGGAAADARGRAEVGPPVSLGGVELRSPLHRGHPLVGKVWDVRRGAFVDLAAVEAAVGAADHVLLGETHDNPDHHALQARLLRAVAAAGRRPAVAFEMLDVDQQAAVDAALSKAPRDPDAVARAVDWAHGGWPDFATYRPVFAAALDAGLPIVAANLSRKGARAVVREGAASLPGGVRGLLQRAGALPPEVQKELRAEMAASHCGELPESILDPMVTMQRARDAQMAERLLAAGERGAVLVAGTGHVRTDLGVPSYLAREAPGRKVVAVGILEVSPELDAPGAYAAQFGAAVRALPLDFVLFTPGAAREDPCEGLRRRMPAKKGDEAKPVPGERSL